MIDGVRSSNGSQTGEALLQNRNSEEMVPVAVGDVYMGEFLAGDSVLDPVCELVGGICGDGRVDYDCGVRAVD